MSNDIDNTAFQDDGSITSAVEQMPDIEALEGGVPHVERPRDDQGRFTAQRRENDMAEVNQANAEFQDTDATLTSEHTPGEDAPEEKEQAEAQAESAEADGDEEEYLEWTVEGDENAEPQRLKVSEVVERIQQVEQLQAELENVRQVQPAPPEYDQHIEQYMERAIALDQQLRQWQAFNQIQPPDQRLLTTGDPNDSAIYYAQLQENERLQQQHMQVAQQLKANEQEYWQARETRAEAQWQREAAKVYQKHPKMRTEAGVREFAADAEALLGIDQQTLDAQRDSRILNALIEHVELKKQGQKAEAEKAKAVRAVKATSRLVRNKARQDPNQTRRSNALKRLQSSGSLDDAADALDGLLDL